MAGRGVLGQMSQTYVEGASCVLTASGSCARKGVLGCAWRVLNRDAKVRYLGLVCGMCGTAGVLPEMPQTYSEGASLRRGLVYGAQLR